MRTGEPLPTVGDVLSALATGLWTWDSAAGTGHAGRRGRPADRAARGADDPHRGRGRGPVCTPSTGTRSSAVVQLAVAEDTLAEVRIRIMDERGRVIRTVRSRSKPDLRPGTQVLRADRHPPGGHRALTGDRRRAHPPSPATGAARARRSCWTRAGRWPRRGPRRRCCGSRRACRCRASPRTGSPSSAWRATASPSSATTGTAGRRGPLHPHAAGDGLSGRRGGPHRPRRLSLLPRGLQGALSRRPGRSPNSSPASPGRSCR